MKCPKCGYVGFESAQRCRNCGYDFSLLNDPLRDLDLPLKSEDRLVAPADFDFIPSDTPGVVAGQRPSAGSNDFDLPSPTPATLGSELPLFTGPAPAAPTAPAHPGQAAPRIAAVTPRRSPTELPRHRPLDFREGQLALEPEPAASPRSASNASARPAGSIARGVAALLDAAILAGLNAAVVYFTLRVCRLSFGDIAILPVAPLVAFFVLLDGAYLVAFTAFGGQTIGKMAASLKVIAEDGGRVIPGQAFARATGYVASLLPAGLGFVPAFFGPSRRALHDRLANTRVVKI